MHLQFALLSELGPLLCAPFCNLPWLSAVLLCPRVCCLVQLLELDQLVVRGLVLRQPSLLARASEGLQSKVTAYADIFGEDVGQVRLCGCVLPALMCWTLCILCFDRLR